MTQRRLDGDDSITDYIPHGAQVTLAVLVDCFVSASKAELKKEEETLIANARAEPLVGTSM